MKLIGGLGQEHCTRAVVNTHLLKEMSLFWELGYWFFFFKLHFVERQCDRERERIEENSCICWFTCH